MQILIFGADWCVACKQLKERLNPYFDKLTSVDVGTEEGIAIAGKYGVNGNIPVVIVEKDGEVIERIEGAKPLAAYERYLIGR